MRSSSSVGSHLREVERLRPFPRAYFDGTVIRCQKAIDERHGKHRRELARIVKLG